MRAMKTRRMSITIYPRHEDWINQKRRQDNIAFSAWVQAKIDEERGQISPSPASKANLEDKPDDTTR